MLGRAGGIGSDPREQLTWNAAPMVWELHQCVIMAIVERKWLTLIVVCVAVFMLLLDITIVNVALPDIGRSLHSDFSDLQWVVDAYSLLLAACLLTAGSLGDLLGRRSVFVVGLAIFSLASLACGLSSDSTVLNLFRGVQGIGGAVMFAQSLALIAEAFQGRERGTAFGIWGAVVGASVAVGPLIGGAITESWGWEWIFFINVPVGAIAIVLSLAYISEARDPNAPGIDWPGLVTFSGGLFLLVFALIRGNAEGWGSTLIVAMLIAAVVLLVGFFIIEWRVSNPMLDLGLFRVPTFAGASIAAFGLSASMFAMFLYLTLYIQNGLHYSPLEAGLRFLPITLTSFVVAPIAGRLSSTVPIRLLLGVGLVLVSAGLLLMHGLTVHSTWTALLAGFLIAGAGIGLVNPPLATTAVGVVPPQRAGMASGINTTFRQVGIATGIAALGAVFQSSIQDKVTNGLSAVVDGRASALAKMVVNQEVPQALAQVPASARPTAAALVQSSFIDALNELLLIGSITALVAAILTFALVRTRDFVGQPSGEPEPQPAAAAAH
jgi:EmrB/QacA subfamily drug resistance transporter